MVTEREPILSDEDLDSINLAVKAIDDMSENITRAKSADIDVADVEKRMDETRRRLVGIKRAFFPDAP